MASRWLFLLCAAAVLRCSSAQDSYSSLQDTYKKGVDLALEQLSINQAVQNHFRFFRSVSKTETEGNFGEIFIFHHFHLKPTTCAKGTNIADPQSCPFRTKRPLMDCAVCYRAVLGQIEPSPTPYVHCIQKPRLTQEMIQKRVDHFQKMTYRLGSPTLLGLSTG